MGSVRFKDELIVDGLDPHVLSEGFKNAVMKLPDEFGDKASKSEYFNFLESWGTVSQHNNINRFAISHMYSDVVNNYTL